VTYPFRLDRREARRSVCSTIPTGKGPSTPQRSTTCPEHHDDLLSRLESEVYGQQSLCSYRLELFLRFGAPFLTLNSRFLAGASV
jgi:hypothetical protein